MSSKPVKAEARLRVTLEVASPQELLERWYPNGKLGGLTLKGELPGPLGTRCDLVVRAAHPALASPGGASPPAVHFKLRGQLAWARHKGSRGMQECFGVDFLADAAAGRERLL